MTLIKRIVPVLLVAGLVPWSARAEEGMWTFDHLPLTHMQKTYGFTPSAEWISNTIKASARLAEGCSASFVSADGLVMTNHHCANSCLAALSDKTHDYFRNGFSAADVAKEPQCPGMELDRLDGVTDVTARVEDRTKGRHGADYVTAMRAISSELTKDCAANDPTHWRCDVVSLYHGGQTALYRYRRYQDVRLVMAPDQDIAFFGGDPDNFNFPRYDIDLSMLRVFENGKPVHTPFFRFDPKGPKAGELVFTSGNPGTTQRTLPTSQLVFERDFLLPMMLDNLHVTEGALWQFSRESAAHHVDAQNAFFGAQNGIKALGGWVDALRTPGVVEKKAAQDADLQKWIDADPERVKEYGHPFQAVEAAVKVERAHFADDHAVSWLYDGQLSNALDLVSAAAERQKPDAQRREGFRDAELPAMEAELGASEPPHRDLDTMTLALTFTRLRQVLGADNEVVRQVLGNAAPDARAHELIAGTKLYDPKARLALYHGGAAAIAASKDPMIVLARALQPSFDIVRKREREEVQAPLREAEGAIARAGFARAKAEGRGDALYPDATFSPRLSYGRVEGWTEGTKTIPAFTDFAGMYRHATGSDPFRLPKVWLDAKPHLDPATHLDFVSTNDITGGNSGSPVIDAQGHVVGLIFDGNIHSLAGPVDYDGSLNRAVATDTSAIFAALRDVYHADALARELADGHL